MAMLPRILASFLFGVFYAAVAIGADPSVVGEVRLINAGTGGCLAWEGPVGVPPEGSPPIVQMACDHTGLWNGNWTIVKLSQGLVGGTLQPAVYEIRNRHLRGCLTISGGVSSEDNVPAVLFTCDGHPSRTWRIVQGGDFHYEIKNVQTGKCLTIASGVSTDNVPAVQVTCDGARSRLWIVALVF